MSKKKGLFFVQVSQNKNIKFLKCLICKKYGLKEEYTLDEFGDRDCA